MKCKFCGVELERIASDKGEFTLFWRFVRWIFRSKHHYFKCSKCGSVYCSQCGLIAKGENVK